MTAVLSDNLLTDEPDHLAGALLRSFSRHLGTSASWSFIKTLFWSTVTFGIGPLLVWPRGLRALIYAERSQFLHLAEWMRLRSGNPNAGRLAEAAKQIKPIGVLSYGPGLIGLLVLLVFAVTLVHSSPAPGSLDAAMWNVENEVGDGPSVSERAHDVRETLLSSTYQYGRTYRLPAETNQLFLIWTVGLTTAYTMHWVQLLCHVSAVRRAVRVFNDLAIVEGLPPVREPGGVGLRPIWLTAALLMMTASAVWAIPMMLAGGMQRRYSVATGPGLRASVADRLRDLLLVRRPVMRVPTMITMPRRCPNEKCRSAMARIANFCSRCGTHVGPEIDELA